MSTRSERAPSGVGEARWVTLAAVAATALAAASLVLTGIGIVRAAHPLPHWDAWDHELGFWFRLTDGDPSAWWAQTNQHRLVMAKVLYAVDLGVFEGRGWFLIACNVLALAGIMAILLALLRWQLNQAGSRSGASWWLFAAAVTSLVCSWIAWENLAWGFEIHFFLAVLLPLGALAALARGGRDHGSGWLVGAAVLTALAPWTNAAGLLTGFLAAALAWALRLSIGWRVAFLGIAVVSTIIYRIGWISAADPLTGLLSQPLAAARYLLLYLGGPAAWITGNQAVGMAAGALLAVATCWYIVLQLRREERSAPGLALAGFIVMVAAQGVATAAVRSQLPIGTAASSRYMTAVLVAWASLLIIAAPRLATTRSRWSVVAAAAVLGIPLLLLPRQLDALGLPIARQNDRRDAATLAIALGVPDQETLAPTYPLMKVPLATGRRAQLDGITVLGTPPWRELSAGLGTPVASPAVTHCAGTITDELPVPNSAFTRITGWVSPSDPLGENPVAVVAAETIVGYAVVGSAPAPMRPDAVTLTGFIRSADRGRPLTVGGEARCAEPLSRGPTG